MSGGGWEDGTQRSANAHILSDVGSQGPLAAKLISTTPGSSTHGIYRGERDCADSHRYARCPSHLQHAVTVKSRTKKPSRPTDEPRLGLLIFGRRLPERPHLQFGSPSFGLLWEFKWSPSTRSLPECPTLATEGSTMWHQIAPHSGLHLHLFAPFQPHSLFWLPNPKWIP